MSLFSKSRTKNQVFDIHQTQDLPEKNDGLLHASLKHSSEDEFDKLAISPLDHSEVSKVTEKQTSVGSLRSLDKRRTSSLQEARMKNRLSLFNGGIKESHYSVQEKIFDLDQEPEHFESQSSSEELRLEYSRRKSEEPESANISVIHEEEEDTSKRNNTKRMINLSGLHNALRKPTFSKISEQSSESKSEQVFRKRIASDNPSDQNSARILEPPSFYFTSNGGEDSLFNQFKSDSSEFKFSKKLVCFKDKDRVKMILTPNKHQNWSGVYEGQAQDDKPHGVGELRISETEYYKGEWALGIINGKGVLKTNTFIYEGGFQGGAFHGKGSVNFFEKGKYKGEFLNGKFDGYGIFNWLCGKAYKGDWKDGRMEGTGHMTWPDGRSYQGHYLRGKKHGFGIFMYSDGREYKGYFKNGKQERVAELKGYDGNLNFKRFEAGVNL